MKCIAQRVAGFLFFMISLGTLSASEPPVLAISAVLDQTRNAAQTHHILSVRDQVVSALVQDYDCVILSRTKGLALAYERSLSGMQNLEAEASPSFIPGIDYSVILFFQITETRDRREHFECTIQVVDLRNQGKEPLRIRKFNPGGRSEYAEKIQHELVELLGLRPRKTPAVRTDQRDEVWAIFPIKRFDSREGFVSGGDAVLSMKLEVALQENGNFKGLVDRQQFGKVLDELSLDSMNSMNENLAGSIARLVGADRMVIGSVREVGRGEVQLDLQLVDGRMSTVLDAVQGRSTPENLDSLGETLVLDLASRTQRLPRLAPVTDARRQVEREGYLSIIRQLQASSDYGVESGMHLSEAAYYLSDGNYKEIAEVASRLVYSVLGNSPERIPSSQRRQVLELLDRMLSPLDAFPPEAKVRLLLARSRMYDEQYDEVIRLSHEQQALTRSEDPMAIQYLIEAYIGKGEFRQAVALLDRAPDSHRVHTLGARAYRSLGDERRELHFLRQRARWRSELDDYAARRLELVRRLEGAEACFNMEDGLHVWTRVLPEVQLQFALAHLEKGNRRVAARIVNGLSEGTALQRSQFSRGSEEFRALGQEVARLAEDLSDITPEWSSLKAVNPVPAQYFIDIQPMGNPDLELIQLAIPIAESMLGVKIRILPTVPMPENPRAYSQARNQYDAYEVVRQLYASVDVPADAICSIVITEQDIFAERYRFVYSSHLYQSGIIVSYNRWMSINNRYAVSRMIASQIASSFYDHYETCDAPLPASLRRRRGWGACSTTRCLHSSDGTGYGPLRKEMAMCERCQDLVRTVNWERVHYVWQNRVDLIPPRDAEHREMLRVYRQAVRAAMQADLVRDGRPEGIVSHPLLETVAPEAAMVSGVKYESFEFERGSVSSVLDLETLEPIRTGVASDIDLALSEREQHIGLVFTGWVDVPVTGTYTFYLMSGDGSRLWIGDQEVIENDGNHAPIMKTGTISLKQGLYPLRLAYYNAGGGRELAVYMRNPNVGSFHIGERMRIPAD